MECLALSSRAKDSEFLDKASVAQEFIARLAVQLFSGSDRFRRAIRVAIFDTGKRNPIISLWPCCTLGSSGSVAYSACIPCEWMQGEQCPPLDSTAKSNPSIMQHASFCFSFEAFVCFSSFQALSTNKRWRTIEQHWSLLGSTTIQFALSSQPYRSTTTFGWTDLIRRAWNAIMKESLRFEVMIMVCHGWSKWSK